MPRQVFPRLRIWGDGLIFLDISVSGTNPPWQWSGNLAPNQIQSILKSLAGQGFFGGWTPEGPNPAGTWLRVGAHLKAQSVEYMNGDPLGGKLYNQLIDQIMPSLKPITLRNANDARIMSVLKYLGKQHWPE